MSHVPIARLVIAALVLSSVSVFAGPLEIDLPAAIDRARRVSPAALAARGEVAVAQGAVVTAELPFVDNPEVEAGAGPRLTTGRPIDAEVRLEQHLELGRRAARRRVARAEVVQVQAERDAALRELDLEVTLAFYDAAFAERSVGLAQRAEEFAQAAAGAADRRRRAGEITDLDANLARSALGRSRAASRAAQSERASAVGRLGALIGAGPDDVIVVRGELRPGALPEAPALRAAVASRPDVRVREAERATAAAQRDQANASALPQVWAWASYQREDTATIVLGGLRLSLPLWNRAQGDQAIAAARQRRASAIRDATLRAAERQLADVLAAYALARDAVDIFERDVAPVLDDNEQLLQKTMTAGQIAVSDYLVARQEILGGRREHLERLLALARAAATVQYVAGGAP